MLLSCKPSLKIIITLLPFVLSACGGGGGGSSTPSPQAEITLDSIAEDDALSASEAMGTINITGSTGGDVVDGDVATLTVNDIDYTGTVTSNRFSIEVSGAELATSTEVFASVTTAAGTSEEVTAETEREFSVAPPVVSLSIDSNIAGDNIINLDESQQDISISGSVEGDVFDGNIVTISVSNETFEGALSDGTFDIAVPGAALVNINEFTASIETTTGSSLGEASSSGSLVYVVSIIPPQVSMIFPWDEAVVDSSVLTITAVVIDDEAIDEVLLNGASVEDITSTTTIPELEEARQSNPGSQVMVVRSEMVLPIGESTISISVSDTVGNTINPEASTVTRITDVPNYLFDDSENNRFIGPVPNIGRESLWVGIDKTSLEVTSLSPFSVPGSVHSVHSESGAIYSVQNSIDGNTTSIRMTSIDGFTTSDLISFDESIIPDGWRFTGLFDMHLNDAGDKLYIMQTLIPPETEDGGWQQIFYSYDIALNQISVLSNVFDGDDSISVRKFAYGGDALWGIISSRNRSTSRELMRIDINDGSKEVVVENLALYPIDITLDRENNTAYIIGLGDDDSVMVNLDSYEVTNIPTSSEDALAFAFPQPRDAVLDVESGRLLVGDSDLPFIATIDIATGERGSYTDTLRVGSGTAIATPSDIYVTDDESTAYVLGGGNNQVHKLLSVDLETGDRSIVLEFPVGGSSRGLSLSIDEENSAAYVVHNYSLYFVDLESGGSAVIASSSIGTGVDIVSIQAATLTGNENELVVAYNDGELLSLNTSTLHRTQLVSTDLEDSIRDLEFDAVNDRIFITTNDSGIFTFSIEETEASILLGECLDDLGENWLVSHGYVKSAGYDSQNNRLVLSGPQYLDTYAEIQLDDLSCNIYSDVYFDDGRYLASGDILAVRKNEVILVESSTRGEAILSK